MRFNCPECGQPINAPEGAEGKQGDCPACGKTVTIPTCSASAKPTAMPLPPQIQQPAPPVLPSQVPALRPFTSSSGTGWIVIGSIILVIAFLWTFYYFFLFETSRGEYINMGLLADRIAGVIVGACAGVGGFAFIGIGYASHCMTYLKESVRLQTQHQK